MLMLEVEWLGQIAYDAAWAVQRRLAAEMALSAMPDRLLLLEHNPVYTIGRSGRPEHLLMSEQECAQQGIQVRRVDRGGDITYHGPGQLVGYPILDLKRYYDSRGLQRPDLHLYLREVEEVLIQTLAAFGVAGQRFAGYTGVWVDTAAGKKKIAAIGVRVSARGISSHGFALNVDPQLAHFAGIIPCGIEDYGVTSLAQLLGQQVEVDTVIEPLLRSFSSVFMMETRFVAPIVYA
jgi:lipoate-protein ligase B